MGCGAPIMYYSNSNNYSHPVLTGLAFISTDKFQLQFQLLSSNTVGSLSKKKLF